ncbi:MAG TPA: LEA type 2 family protein [Thermoanaerobaculia bacterium]|nr:LEA type 2 family protein [Thermoanaerobaculia bacterium]
MKHTDKYRLLRGLALVAIPLSLLAVLTACSGYGFGQALRSPDVHVVGASVEEVNLAGADLLFEFEVDNPNGLALVLDQVGYKLRINGQHLLDGYQDDRTTIAARTESRVELPVKIRLDDAYRVLRSFQGRGSDRPQYELEADFRFDAPVVGGITVPVRKTGVIPVERLLQYIPSR